MSEKSVNSNRFFLWHVMVVAVTGLIPVATNWLDVPSGLYIPVLGVRVPPVPCNAKPFLRSGA
jgi:hypothetical protein